MSEQRLFELIRLIHDLCPGSSIPEIRQIWKYRTPGYSIINDRVRAQLSKRTHERLRASTRNPGQINLFTGKTEGEVND